MKRSVWLVVLVVAVLAVVGVIAWRTFKDRVGPCDLSSYDDQTRDALTLTSDPYGDVTSQIVYLDQGWQPRDSMDYYTRTQGSRLIPYSWFLALEQPANDRLFRDPANINRLRYLPQKDRKSVV